MQSKNTNIKSNNKLTTLIIISAIIIITVVALALVLPKNAETTQDKDIAGLNGEGVTILKSEITNKASFFPYQAGDTYMEVIAIKASDGTVRTALNTCQVCTGSGRAYYEQDGDDMVCQNCGNRFTVDQIEVVKGGCNPVPVLKENKTEDNDTIKVSDEFLSDNKDLFVNWKN